ncbi:hypothetical protein D9758_011657 [Tetrapyrgos nigripes]|uniref:RRM domain-containing protein n=1 Tax=Tetrapyrgos nigripes TaxID=182062 RepID=A0A8H5FSG4_9AGAR|nr:hypothetical protein D9758_011657 [Tetrapyrgos nigripes]
MNINPNQSQHDRVSEDKHTGSAGSHPQALQFYDRSRSLRTDHGGRRSASPESARQGERTVGPNTDLKRVDYGTEGHGERYSYGGLRSGVVGRAHIESKERRPGSLYRQPQSLNLAQPSLYDPRRTLFIWNISYHSKPEAIRAHFDAHGRLETYDQFIRSHGVAFVTYYDSSDAERAQKKLDGFEVLLAKLNISFVHPKSRAMDYRGFVIIKSSRPLTKSEVEDKFTGFPRRLVLCRFYDTRQCLQAFNALKGNLAQDGLRLELAWNEEDSASMIDEDKGIPLSDVNGILTSDNENVQSEQVPAESMLAAIGAASRIQPGSSTSSTSTQMTIAVESLATFAPGNPVETYPPPPMSPPMQMSLGGSGHPIHPMHWPVSFPQGSPWPLASLANQADHYANFTPSFAPPSQPLPLVQILIEQGEYSPHHWSANPPLIQAERAQLIQTNSVMGLFTGNVLPSAQIPTQLDSSFHPRNGNPSLIQAERTLVQTNSVMGSSPGPQPATVQGAPQYYSQHPSYSLPRSILKSSPSPAQAPVTDDAKNVNSEVTGPGKLRELLEKVRRDQERRQREAQSSPTAAVDGQGSVEEMGVNASSHDQQTSNMSAEKPGNAYRTRPTDPRLRR